MRAGATLLDPGSVTLSYDTVLGRDVVVEPHVMFAPGVIVADGARIRAFSHLEGVRVGTRAIVGPFARLRPGSVLGEGRARRQFRRGEGVDARGRGQGQSSLPTSATPASARAATSVPAPSRVNYDGYPQVAHDDRCRCLRRQPFLPDRAGDHRRGRLYRHGFGGDGRRFRRMRSCSPVPARSRSRAGPSPSARGGPNAKIASRTTTILKGFPCAASSGSSAGEPVADRLVEALKRLEYRGYDSAGRRHAGGAAISCAAARRAS